MLFAAFYTWMIKLGSTVAFALGGFLINLTGFSVANGSAQSGQTIFRMRVVDFLIPALAITLAMVLVGRFALTEQLMLGVRRKLEALQRPEGEELNRTATESCP